MLGLTFTHISTAAKCDGIFSCDPQIKDFLYLKLANSLIILKAFQIRQITIIIRAPWILLLITYMQQPPLNIYADVSSGARSILQLHRCFVYASRTVLLSVHLSICCSSKQCDRHQNLLCLLI